MSAQVLELARVLPRRSTYVITPEEMDALYGVGPLAFMVYHWLRAWMDYRTGIVGVTRALSREMLRTYCETHTPRGQGIQASKPSLDQLRTAIKALERSGLLRRRDTELLVFSMPLAQTENVRAIQTSPSDPRLPPRTLTSSDGGFTGEPHRVVAPNVPYIRSQEKLLLSTSQAAATDPPEVDVAAPVAAAASEDMEVSMSVDDARMQLIRDVLNTFGVRVPEKDAIKVESWVRRGLTYKQVHNACVKAKGLRDKQGSEVAIHINYIDTMLRDVRPSRTAKAEDPPSEDRNWRKNSASIRREAMRHGMSEKLVTVGDKQRMETIWELAQRVAERRREEGIDHG